MRLPTKTLWAHLAMLAATLLYGGNYSVAKGLMPYPLPPFGFIMVRILVATSIFWMLHALSLKERIRHKTDFIKLAGCGLFGVCINMLFFFKGLSQTSPINASLIMITTPILVLLLSCSFGRERLTIRKALGMMIGFGGAMLLLFSQGNTLTLSTDTWAGDLMVMINALSYGTYLVLVKSLMKTYHPLTVIKWVFLLGCLMTLPFAFQEFRSISWTSLSAGEWGGLGYVVLGATVCTYLLNASALRHVNPSIVGYYVYIQPVFATLIEILAGREVPTWLKITSAILIIWGVQITSPPGLRKRR